MNREDYRSRRNSNSPSRTRHRRSSRAYAIRLDTTSMPSILSDGKKQCLFPRLKTFSAVHTSRPTLPPFGGQKINTSSRAIYHNGFVYTVNRSNNSSVNISRAPVPGSFKRVVLKKELPELSDFSLSFLNDSLLLIAGGSGPTVTSNQAILVNVETGDWELASSIGPVRPPRTNAASVTTRHRDFYITYTFGGYVGADVSDELEISIFSENSINFEKGGVTRSVCVYTAAAGPCARADHTMLMSDGRIFLFGGVDARGECLNDLWELEFTDNQFNPQWRFLSASGPSPRMRTASFMKEGAMYIAGGLSSNGTPPNDIWRWENNTWIRVSNVESTLPLIGTPKGLFYYSSRLFPIREMRAVRVLDSKFSELQRIQSLYSAMLTIEDSAEMSSVRINSITTSLLVDLEKGSDSLSKAEDIVGDEAKEQVAEELRKLRVEFLALSKKCSESGLIIPGKKTKLYLSEFKTKLQQKIDAFAIAEKLPKEENVLSSVISNYISKDNNTVKQSNVREVKTSTSSQIDCTDKRGFRDFIENISDEKVKRSEISAFKIKQLCEFEKNIKIIEMLQTKLQTIESQNIAKLANISTIQKAISTNKDIIAEIPEQIAQLNKMTNESKKWASMILTKEDVEKGSILNKYENKNEKYLEDLVNKAVSVVGDENSGLKGIIKLTAPGNPITKESVKEIERLFNEIYNKHN